MKADFLIAKEELAGIGILRVCTDFYSEPKQRGSVFFVKSPATHDKTASLAIYPSTNRFCDFANCNYSGDIIGFVAYVRGLNQWEALKELRVFYNLTDCRQQDREELHRRIKLQQEKDRQIRERCEAFHRALYGEIGRLKQWEDILTLALEKRLYAPYSELWEYCVREKQKAAYKLDILSGADIRTYPRLKRHRECMASDRPQWILDCLAILQESGVFAATESEMGELMAQRNFELTRKPGQERRCTLEW